MPIKADEPRDKKPRIRHTEAQLAALNDLYEENEHPSLEERAALAERLGMYVLFFFRPLSILGEWQHNN